MKLTLLALVGVAFIAVGCSNDSDPVLAKSNRENGYTIAQLNAQKYARENYPNQDVFVTGDIDSYATAKCPQGDGFASWSVKDTKTGQEIMPLQCRTSELTGCFRESEAPKKGDYMKNQCNNDIPRQIEKVK